MVTQPMYSETVQREYRLWCDILIDNDNLFSLKVTIP